MGSRGPRLPQTQTGSDVKNSNNVSTVVGIQGVPFVTPPIPGAILQMDPQQNTMDWVTNILAAYLDQAVLNKLLTDQQGLILLDQSGNAYYGQ